MACSSPRRRGACERRPRDDRPPTSHPLPPMPPPAPWPTPSCLGGFLSPFWSRTPSSPCRCMPAVAVFRKRDGVPMAVVAPTDDQRGHVAVGVGASRRLDAVKLAGRNSTFPVWAACWGDGVVAAVTLASALGHRPRRRLWTLPAVPVVPAPTPSHFLAAFAPPPPLVPVFHRHVRRGAELTTPTPKDTLAASGRVRRAVGRVRRAVGRCGWRPCRPTGNANLEFRQISTTDAVMAPFWLRWH